jgi:putative phosphonate metabolism protein
VTAPRYAIYFAPPPHSPWWEFGTRWLGRDEVSNAARAQLGVAGIETPRLHALTATPRRYGFHATLKAPFRLRSGIDETALLARVRALAERLRPVTLTPLVARRIDGFVALVPDTVPPGLAEIEAACVTELDVLRAPPAETELAARRAAGLDARAEELLARYGYPRVLDRFRLHFTLTDRIGEADAARVCDAVRDLVQDLNNTAALMLDRLCVFVEPLLGRDLVRVTDAVFGVTCHRQRGAEET